ncbi:hypothetical protein XELAEV_18016708mg [Xenopus laevis]|uniref:Uncharacterized protein n=1 Tax=Xenopus laevis TaxID=8355 RepID=A0A974HSA9_XENLA|nr:hypothetical protein XELAEV_18016708mg [Xenopus laevis]
MLFLLTLSKPAIDRVNSRLYNLWHRKLFRISSEGSNSDITIQFPLPHCLERKYSHKAQAVNEQLQEGPGGNSWGATLVLGDNVLPAGGVSYLQSKKSPTGEV